MRGLTLTQPWATLIAQGAKQIETRPWATSYRGPLAIHAAKGLGPVGGNRGLNELVAQEPFWSTLMAAGCTFGRRAPTGLPLGAIVAVCELVSIEEILQCDDELNGYWRIIGGVRMHWPMTDQERAFGKFAPGRWAWLLSDIRALPEPVPYRGAQGLRELDEATRAMVERQLKQEV